MFVPHKVSAKMPATTPFPFAQISHEKTREAARVQKLPYSPPKLTVYGSKPEFLARRSVDVQLGHEVSLESRESAASWYSLNLVEEPRELVELAWEVSRSGAERDYGNAIFQRLTPGKGLTLYFSPAAGLLAKAYAAKPCARPSPVDMNLLVGDKRAWQIHFGRVFARPKQPFAETRPSGFSEPTLPSPLQ
ncbi:MAG: hypothetical protein ABI409_06245 [Ramlibacter sp.]